jgi:hypothetical protein
LSNINKKIPNWVKLLLKLLLLSILGFSSIFIFFFLSNINYIKIFSYFSCSLVIIFQLFNLYLLHKFSNKNIKISAEGLLPDFIINWLKDIEIISSNKKSINEFKKTCYIEILVYLLIIILITLFL